MKPPALGNMSPVVLSAPLIAGLDSSVSRPAVLTGAEHWERPDPARMQQWVWLWKSPLHQEFTNKTQCLALYKAQHILRWNFVTLKESLHGKSSHSFSSSAGLSYLLPSITVYFVWLCCNWVAIHVNFSVFSEFSVNSVFLYTFNTGRNIICFVGHCWNKFVLRNWVEDKIARVWLPMRTGSTCRTLKPQVEATMDKQHTEGILQTFTKTTSPRTRIQTGSTSWFHIISFIAKG